MIGNYVTVKIKLPKEPVEAPPQPVDAIAHEEIKVQPRAENMNRIGQKNKRKAANNHQHENQPKPEMPMGSTESVIAEASPAYPPEKTEQPEKEERKSLEHVNCDLRFITKLTQILDLNKTSGCQIATGLLEQPLFFNRVDVPNKTMNQFEPSLAFADKDMATQLSKVGEHTVIDSEEDSLDQKSTEANSADPNN